jgi:VWFA-related protein
MRSRARTVVALLILGGAALVAQTPAPRPPQGPTFRINVDYVEVDAVVTDAGGSFVRDLKQDDFQIFEDGQPQTISTFSLVDIPIERAQRPLYAAAPIEPDVRTNGRPFDGRVYVMVIDDLHTYFGRTPRVRAAARQFIQDHFGANDLMAVVHTSGASDANQEFTSDKRLLLAAADRTSGRKLDPPWVTRTNEALRGVNSSSRETGALTDPDDNERQANARQSLEILRNVADWFSTVRGRRKSILFVSEGLDYDITSFENPGSSTVISLTRDALAAAARSNVSVYGIDPRGLTNLGDQTIEVQTFADDTAGSTAEAVRNELFLAQGSLRELSDQTGGFAVLNANDFTTAFDRIVRDNSSYYAMAYYPPSKTVGKAHRIEVKVRRPGLIVRARRGYITPRPVTDRPRGAADAIASGGSLPPELRSALDSPLPLSGLTMSVFAAPFKGAAPNASVLLGIEMEGSDLRLDPNDKVTVSYAAIDVAGKVRDGAVDTLSAKLPPELRSRVAASGLRLLKRLNLPPGRYQLHVAAHDQGGGTTGSLVYDLTVPDFAKLPFSISGLALTAASALSQPTVRPDEALKDVLPAPPVGARVFPQNDTIALFAEVYDNETSKPHQVDITTTVTSDEGKVLIKSAEARNSSELKGARGGYGFAARLALKDLPPGSYVLTLSAQSRLNDGPPAERQVPFVVTAARASTPQ